MRRKIREAGRNRRRVLDLWALSPKCHWCGVATVLESPGPIHPPNRATLDHFYPKRIRARTPKGIKHAGHTVLSCYRCNQSKGERTAGEFLRRRG